MVDDDVQNIFVEGNEGYQKAKIIYKASNAKTNKKVKKYRDKTPLFLKITLKINYMKYIKLK